MAKRFVLAIVAAMAMLALSSTPAEALVEIKDNQLFIDSVGQPQLYGAEVQYFRLRGGSERNIPRAKVIELWNKALDRFVEAKMNTISFYIPWDFHEYAPGKFDFDGTVDEDGDGQPDYPSRDVRTWFKLVEAHGIKHIMVRPGPYINAEWGFLGFGAVPLWFHTMYPESHAHNPRGQRTPVYSYSDPDFLRESKRWLETVYGEVIAPHIGPGKPVSFVQLDNETNFQWSSLYSHDFGARSVALYQEFLKARYGTIDALNFEHQRSWRTFADVRPPYTPWMNLSEDQDWYRYEDESIHVYLSEIRKVWENLGVREPQILFTLAESYNASSEGLLPHFGYRNDPGRTGMMTVNLYPKTYETDDSVLMNTPFKADLDVKSADSASDHYLGRKEEWVMGPEIQGGWWRGTPVSRESRQQTYLTVLGHGMKAMLVYYFNEGDNFGSDWAKEQILPYYRLLREDPRFKSVSADQLPDAFWNELDQTIANEVLAGWSSRWLLAQGGSQPKQLYFDAAVGPDAEVRPPFQLLKTIGERIVEPYGQFLAQATEAVDPVCMIKDSASHVPSKVPGLNSLRINSDWAAGLLGLLLHSGLNPKILHWGLTPESEYASCRLFVYQDNGFATQALDDLLERAISRGATVVSFLHDGAFNVIGSGLKAQCQPLAHFDGSRCTAGTGHLYHVRSPIYEQFNSDYYPRINDVPARREFFEVVMDELKLKPIVQIAGGGDRVVAFARRGVQLNKMWITIKSGQTQPTKSFVQWSEARPSFRYRVTRVLDGTVQIFTGEELSNKGFAADLEASGSDIYFVEPEARPVARADTQRTVGSTLKPDPSGAK